MNTEKPRYNWDESKKNAVVTWKGKYFGNLELGLNGWYFYAQSSFVVFEKESELEGYLLEKLQLGEDRVMWTSCWKITSRETEMKIEDCKEGQRVRFKAYHSDIMTIKRILKPTVIECEQWDSYLQRYFLAYFGPEDLEPDNHEDV